MILTLHYANAVSSILTDKDLQRRWFKDLRSETYHQIDNMLYDDSCNGYCAIGLLLRKRISKNGKLQLYSGEQELFNNIIIESEEGYKFTIEDFIIEINDQMKLSFIEIEQILKGINDAIQNKETFYEHSRICFNTI